MIQSQVIMVLGEILWQIVWITKKDLLTGKRIQVHYLPLDTGISCSTVCFTLQSTINLLV